MKVGLGFLLSTQHSALSEKLRAERSAVLGFAQVEQLRRVPPVEQTSVTQHFQVRRQEGSFLLTLVFWKKNAE